MNKTEYREYKEAVKAFFEREGINCLSQKYNYNGDPIEEEFSWRQCECCGSSLGGPRYTMKGYVPSSKPGRAGEVFEYKVCQDCWYYTTYAQLDDQTMLDIEEEDE